MVPESLISLTSKDRILLYLSDFHHMDERYELPSELVQEAIANSTGIQRKHLSQYLDDLMREGCIVERKAHIKGMRQRMNGYYLTSAGTLKAADLRTKVGDTVVEVKVNGGARKMRVSEIDAATPFRVTLCDIVRVAMQRGMISFSDLNGLDADKRQAEEEADRNTVTYKRALETAWRDGVVTATERFLVDELRKHLEISEEKHRKLEEEILKRLAQTHMEFLRIYRSALEIAMADGALEGPEVEILDNLRKMLRISPEEHAQLVDEVITSIRGPAKRIAEDAS